jgi:hypothetical protein
MHRTTAAESRELRDQGCRNDFMVLATLLDLHVGIS